MIIIRYLSFIIKMYKNSKSVFLTTCGQCDSNLHEIIKDERLICDDGIITYNAKFKCLKCGAIGEVNEVWSKEDS